MMTYNPSWDSAKTTAYLYLINRSGTFLATGGNMRIDTVHGLHLLCGGIIPASKVEPGQTWAPADGSKRTVTVDKVSEDWVEYSWDERGERKTHSKLNFAFQCRYCLVLQEPILPNWAK